MSDLFQGLNPAQRRAVETIDGPVLVLAGPGSGKTRVLTHRIAHLIRSHHIDPYAILAVTFTNKAARELKERLAALIGRGVAQTLTVGTFHSLCARFLRKDMVYLGRERDFIIYDGDDQERLMRRVLRDLNLDEKQNQPRAILGRISSAKNELVSPAEYARLNRTYFDEIVVRCYERYQALLREANALDFDDLLVETVRLFELNPEVLARYQERYAYLLGDEYQDTNRVQYVLVKQLAGQRRNLFAVGDDDQCFPAGTLIRTPDGERVIEQIKPGDTVLAGAGRGTTAQAQVLNVRAKPYTGTLIRVTLASGQVFAATPNHICFARLGLREDVHYVYLMYREDQGYRVGVAKGARSDGRGPALLNGLQVRVNQQQADKVWLLRVCATRGEAQVYEQFYSVNYGIPTLILFVGGRGDVQLTQEQIDWLYNATPSRANAERLMHDLGLYAGYPHYRPSGIHAAEQRHRLTVHLTAFGGHAPSEQAPWYRHRVWLTTSDRLLEQQVVPNGRLTRPGNRQTWRIERSYKELDRTALLAEEIARAVGGADVARWAALTSGTKFAFQPAAHLRPTMIVPVWCEGQLVDAEVVKVEEVTYEGVIYDLDIEHLHNYIANGVAVHNSVYGWRGADIRNIRSFEQDYPNAQVILLEQNYRSTQAILDTAQALISAGTKHTHLKKLWTENGAGLQVSLHTGHDQDHEAALVADEIARLVASGDCALRDCAVMYRTNAQSRALEEALSHRGLRYQIVGGTRFWERKEVKDLLAYLRLAANPYDSIGLTRVLNWPTRGIGERTVSELTRWATQLGVPVFQALKELESDLAPSPFSVRTTSALLGFLRLADELGEARRQLHLVELIERLLERVPIREALVREHGDEEADERWANIEELTAFASRYSELPLETQLSTFLEEVALVADVDKLDSEADVVTCITLHQAKGLEYTAVFLVGLEDGLLPHSRSLDEPEKVEEERRLLYVGMTRAKRRLYLCYASKRTSFGRTNLTTRSRFLDDIPRELIKATAGRRTASGAAASGLTGRGVGGDSGVGRGMPRSTSWGDPRAKSTVPTGDSPKSAPANTPRPTPQPPTPPPTEVRFFPGQRVRHERFGEGVVVSSRLVEDDEEVTVSFADRERRLLATLARLQHLEG